MIRIVREAWSLQDDIIFENPSYDLYALGCAWNCPGCHNGTLQSFESPDAYNISYSDRRDYLRSRLDLLDGDLTVLGLGGDFWFQFRDWLDFNIELKRDLPSIKTVWYTGAEYEERLATNIDLQMFDAILWGKLKHVDGMVYKHVTKATDNHKNPEIRFISEFIPPKESKNVGSIHVSGVYKYGPEHVELRSERQRF